jgi:hypothetical protein
MAANATSSRRGRQGAATKSQTCICVHTRLTRLSARVIRIALSTQHVGEQAYHL